MTDRNAGERQPLSGVTIVDLTHVLAGPLCTFQLALLGADVVKVEMPGRGDLLRRLGSDAELNRRLMSSPFLALNAGKRSVTANLRSEGGREVVRRLVAGGDVLVENFRPGVLARHGLAYEDLKAINPRLVYCSLTGFGQDGPLRDSPAFDHVLQAMSGIMALTGTGASGPVKAGFPVIDSASGFIAAYAVLAALMRRERCGAGAHIDVSMLEATLSLLSTQVADYLFTGTPPERLGNAALSGSAASDCFAAPEGPLLIAANTERQFKDLMVALDLADLIDDSRFSEWERRTANREALRQAIETALKRRPAREWETRLNAAGVPAAVVRSLPDILEEPQVRDRGFLASVEVPALDREASVPTTGFVLDGLRPRPAAGASELGADTDEVLGELGYSEAEIKALRAKGDI